MLRKSYHLQLIEQTTAWRLVSRASSWYPPTDIYETDDELVVRMEIAGMREEDFEIELNGRTLIIRGQRLDTPERRAYHQLEIRFGEFYLEVELPIPVEATHVEASYTAGLLRIVLPKAKPLFIPGKEQD